MKAGGLYGEARQENFQMVLCENGNKETFFDVSKLTVFCVEVW